MNGEPTVDRDYSDLYGFENYPFSRVSVRFTSSPSGMDTSRLLVVSAKWAQRASLCGTRTAGYGGSRLPS